MADVKWIKIVTDIFDDEKIKLIEAMPDADSIVVIWFKLLCLAGHQNNCGVFMLNNKIAYTDEMLSTIFRRPLNTVRLALQTFESYGMVEIVNGVYTIPNWNKHQNLDAIEKKREYDRLYQQEKRAKQKQLVPPPENTPSYDCQTTIVPQNKNENKNKNENNSSSNVIDKLEVADYFRKRGRTEEEAKRFFDKFSAVGWKLADGKPIRCWQSFADDFIGKIKNDGDGNAGASYSVEAAIAEAENGELKVRKRHK